MNSTCYYRENYQRPCYSYRKQMIDAIYIPPIESPLKTITCRQLIADRTEDGHDECDTGPLRSPRRIRAEVYAAGSTGFNLGWSTSTGPLDASA